MSIFRKLAAIALMALFVLAGPVGAQQAQPLPVEDAFKVSLMASGSGVEVVLNVAPGYYLYRDQISLADAEGQAVALQLPSGVTKDDPTFGRTEIFHDRLSFPLPEATAGKFILAYQGCKDGSICYPPVRRSLDADALAVGSVEGPSFLTESSEALGAATPIRVATETGGSLLTDLMGRGGALMVIGAFLAFGVALAFTPCVFPMYPILAGTLTQAGQRLSMPKAFGISLVYVLGMATAFGMLGLVAAWSGQNLQMVLQSPWAIGGVVVLFITLAISMFGAFELQLPSAWMTTISRVGGRNGAAGAAMMGFLSALIVGPCVTAPLAAALLYIAQTGDATLGAAARLVAVVASASNTPIAAILMGVELFGGVTGTIYVAGAAMAAYVMIGHRSVYPDQLVAYPKSTWMHGGFDRPVGEEKIRLSYGLLKWLNRMQMRRDRLFRRGAELRHRARDAGDDKGRAPEA